MSIVNWIVAAVFFLCAAVQYNDPDALPWAAVYLLAVAACLVWRRKSCRPWARWLAVATGLAALAWALTYAPAVSQMAFGDLFRAMKAETPAIELARELLGLLMVVAWMAVLAVRHES